MFVCFKILIFICSRLYSVTFVVYLKNAHATLAIHRSTEAFRDPSYCRRQKRIIPGHQHRTWLQQEDSDISISVSIIISISHKFI